MAKYKFNSFGVMIDMSRNAVMSVEGLKRFLPILKKMGYNCAMLYTEDTYEVKDEPYFGYMRGRYSIAEMKELDEYATSIGVELLPCIQTLAHLNAAIRWNTFPIDCNDILLTDDPRTYELIDHMFLTLSECFKSRRIHVGMDEAHMLGRGRHLDLHGYETANDCIKRHLAKVRELAGKYGYTLLMWSDMFFRPMNGGNYYMEKMTVPKEVKDAVPSDVVPVYWDYYHFDEKSYDDMIYNHMQISKDIWFAGGIWSWSGLVPHNKSSIESMKPAMAACRKNKLRNALFTMWGDDGGECSHFSQLPALFYLAENSKGNEDDELIREKFRRMFGLTFEDFMALDLPNNIDNGLKFPNPSKYMFFSDYFNGFLDSTVNSEGAKKYAEYAEKLHAIAKKSRKYAYIFDSEAKLCEVLAIKYDLGARTRAAYEKGDKEALRSLAENEYKEVAKRIRAFHAAFEKQWFADNKPTGFDVQDIRIGGLIQRTESCRRRLMDYAAGKLERIPELEEKVLPFPGTTEGQATAYNSYTKTATANVMGAF